MKRVILPALIVFGACSDDTGLLVEVHGDQLQGRVTKLETMVILDDGQGAAPDSLAWGATPPVASAVEGVDLLAEPYTVLIEPSGDEVDGAVWVAAVAFDEGQNLIGWGQLPGAVGFEAGAVKRVALDLHAAYGVDAGCVVKGDGNIVIRTGDDCDGDGADYTIDCHDLDPTIVDDQDGDPAYCWDDCAPGDPAIYPGNKEECDGLDNDCDEITQPDPQFCAQVIYDPETAEVVTCRIGQRVCADDDPSNASYGACVSAPVEADGAIVACDRWGECGDAGDLGCFFDGGLRCTVEHDAGEPCLPAATPLHGLLPDDTLDCAWSLIGNVQQGGWNAGLRAAGSSSGPATFADTCDAELVVTAADASPRIYVVEAFDGLTRYQFGILLRPGRGVCDGGEVEPLACEPLL